MYSIVYSHKNLHAYSGVYWSCREFPVLNTFVLTNIIPLKFVQMSNYHKKFTTWSRNTTSPQKWWKRMCQSVHQVESLEFPWFLSLWIIDHKHSIDLNSQGHKRTLKKLIEHGVQVAYLATKILEIHASLLHNKHLMTVLKTPHLHDFQLLHQNKIIF